MRMTGRIAKHRRVARQVMGKLGQTPKGSVNYSNSLGQVGRLPDFQIFAAPEQGNGACQKAVGSGGKNRSRRPLAEIKGYLDAEHLPAKTKPTRLPACARTATAQIGQP